MLSITRFTSPVLSDVPTLQSRLSRLFDEAFRGWPVSGWEDRGSLAAKPRQIAVNVETK